MRSVSMLNDVLGPIMRGPSSSHTAAAWRISTLARGLLGERVKEAEFTFDPWGSWGVVYDQQGSDLAFAAGLLGWSLEDGRFFDALKQAPGEGLAISFRLEPLPWATHPNDVRLRLRGQEGDAMEIRGRSIGGGAIEVTAVDEVPVLLRGDSE
ncbi:MAG TPA: serine dehydratase, partial [Synergistaceae bacterium]|nr:serine dehydratase [Synergistaceae bacterium]